eukprot:COSAG02_NODE_32099_length_522_cov_1.011820_1_plen_86_part_10
MIAEMRRRRFIQAACHDKAVKARRVLATIGVEQTPICAANQSDGTVRANHLHRVGERQRRSTRQVQVMQHAAPDEVLCKPEDPATL